ncbi:siphovirus Gp157 family protein [Microvirga sp. GCM10011540]|uniref:siphovirus Gp157 family protein n=1 Tax=Microvirga sp. GCM10011540 TaxID=3317338 RepID=UPI003612D681
MNPLNVAQIEREIETLIAAYPELAEDETLRADMIAGSTKVEEVLSSLAGRILDAQAMATAIVKRKNDLDARLAACERREEAYRSLSLRIMNAASLRKMPLPEATLSIRAVPPAVIISDEEQIPAEFTKTKVSPDRTKIKDALAAGAEVPGAYLSNGSESLSVRTK